MLGAGGVAFSGNGIHRIYVKGGTEFFHEFLFSQAVQVAYDAVVVHDEKVFITKDDATGS